MFSYVPVDRSIFLEYNKTNVAERMLQNKTARRIVMPPKAKFTREEIISAALEMVREKGFDALTARALGERLGSSARPIFTVFHGMEEVQEAVMDAARALYNGYIQTALEQKDGNVPRFKCVGEQYIRFAITEPKLFQLLFMKEQEGIPNFLKILPIIESNYEDILVSIEQQYGLERVLALRLYQHLWVYTHGIASLCATGMCSFTGEEIGAMMTEVFKSLIKEMKR